MVSHPEVAAQMLEALGVHAEAPPLAKARAPPARLGFERPVDDPGIDPCWPDHFDSRPEYGGGGSKRTVGRAMGLPGDR